MRIQKTPLTSCDVVKLNLSACLHRTSLLNFLYLLRSGLLSSPICLYIFICGAGLRTGSRRQPRVQRASAGASAVSYAISAASLQQPAPFLVRSHSSSRVASTRQRARRACRRHGRQSRYAPLWRLQCLWKKDARHPLRDPRRNGLLWYFSRPPPVDCTDARSGVEDGPQRRRDAFVYFACGPTLSAGECMGAVRRRWPMILCVIHFSVCAHLRTHSRSPFLELGSRV